MYMMDFLALSMMPVFSSIEASTVMKESAGEVLNGPTLEVPGTEIRIYIVGDTDGSINDAFILFN